jgi:hypothetical protein
VNKGKNFPSFQMLLACWVISKICTCFAAGRALVAENCRAMNTSSSLKTPCNSKYFMQ